MIYILVDNQSWKQRCSGEVLNVESIAVEILKSGEKCKIISQKLFMNMVDDYVYPSSDSDKIYIRSLNLDILNASKKLEARGFKLVNSFDTLTVLRDYKLLNEKLVENKIPTVYLHDQTIAKTNLDRTRGFGQNFNDFLVEYVREYNIQEFYLRAKNFNYLHKLQKKNSYISDDINLDCLWMIFECPPVKKYTRSRVINGKYVDNSTICSSTLSYSSFEKFKNPAIETLVNSTAKAINLEIGIVEIAIDISESLRVFACFESSFETVTNGNHHIKIAKYLLK